MPQVWDRFASAFEISDRRWDPIWRAVIHWDDPTFLSRILDLIDDELEARWKRGAVEDACRFAAAFINATPQQPSDAVDAPHQLHWIRFHVSTQLLQMSNSAGRFPMAFDWICVSLSDQEYAPVAPGTGVDINFERARLLEFLQSDVNQVGCDAQLRVPLWIDQFFYYVMRTGGHQAVAREFYPFCMELVRYGINSGVHLNRWIAALCQIASWATKAGADQAETIAQQLADFFEAGLPIEIKKHVGITLAGHVGTLLPNPTAIWARRTLQECGDILVAHERLQLLVGSCQTSTEYVAQTETLIAAATSYSNEARAHARNYADFCYGQIRLFNIIAPFVLALLRERQTASLVRLLAIWFGLPSDTPRVSEILFILPSSVDGVLFGTRAECWAVNRDAEQALSAIVVAGNAFLGTASMATGLIEVTEPATCQISTDPAINSAFEEALTAFYELEQLQPLLGNLAECRISGMCIIPGFQHPVQAVMLKHLGVTWPLVIDFNEPKQFRTVSRALLFTAGTTTGEYAVRGIASYLSTQGVTCDTIINQAITPEQFLERYSSEDYDLVWVEAHGEFVGNDPHRSRILLGWDASVAVTAQELLQCTPQQENRRLLVLNICEGGTPMVFDAPPKLGIAPLLTGASQSVISHLWPVRSDIAPVFGLLLAIGYRTTQDWFRAFCYATNTLRQDCEAINALLAAAAGAENAIVERVAQKTGSLSEDKICFWGSPVFYE